MPIFKRAIKTAYTEIALWKTTPCQLSATASSICSQLPSILEAITWGRAVLSCKMEDHPMSAVSASFFNMFAATLHIGGYNVRTRHAVMTGDTKLILYIALRMTERQTQSVRFHYVLLSTATVLSTDLYLETPYICEACGCSGMWSCVAGLGHPTFRRNLVSSILRPQISEVWTLNFELKLYLGADCVQVVALEILDRTAQAMSKYCTNMDEIKLMFSEYKNTEWKDSTLLRNVCECYIIHFTYYL